MTKKLITRTKEFNITYYSVEEVIRVFNEEKAKLPTNSYLESGFTHEDEYTRVVMQIKYRTEQTEDELRVERIHELNKLEWKRKQLAALKKELGE